MSAHLPNYISSYAEMFNQPQQHGKGIRQIPIFKTLSLSMSLRMLIGALRQTHKLVRETSIAERTGESC